MVGIGMSVSAAMPVDDTLTTGPDLALNVERYLSRRVSLRGQFSGAWLEALFHAVPGDTTSPLTHHNPRYWTLALGFKKYF